MGTTKREYTDAEKLQVWKMAKEIDNIDSDIWRQDYAGAWIRFSDYGNRNSQYGWEIDHLKPLSKDGLDDSTNWLPLQWQNNVRKGDDYPRWATAVTSDGRNNIAVEKYWKINS